MYKLVLVGDTHHTPQETKECEELIKFVASVAIENKAGVVFLGDQNHYMGIVNLESIYFWEWAFGYLKENRIEVKALCGNHDFNGNTASNKHSMVVHKHITHIIDKPYEEKGILFLPWMKNSKELVDIANKSNSITLMGHMEVLGAFYDNGHKIDHGVNIDELKQTTIISGHIHSQQEFGKLHYTGASRARTLGDANLAHGLWVYNFTDEGQPISKSFIDSKFYAKRILHYIDSEDSPLDLKEVLLSTNPKDDIRVDILGTESYINTRKLLYKAYPKFKLRIFKNNKQEAKVKESEGIAPSFNKFLDNYKAPHNTPIEVLRTMSKDLFNG